ncbi:uncharacterized protein LOC111114709 [Crassostrea virginica]
MSTLYIIVGLGVYCLAYENIALNKPAFQHYPYPYADKIGGEHLIQAGNAVDGLRSNLSVLAGQCVISDNGKQNATLWVNLGSIFSIHHMTIYYRTANAPWGNGNVSHLPGCDCDISCMSEVMHEPLEEVAKRYKKYWVNNKLDNDPRFTKLKTEDIVRIIEATKGPQFYDIFKQNCEHYAFFCRYGESRSFQVEDIAAAIKSFHRVMENLRPVWEKVIIFFSNVLLPQKE